MLTEANHKAGTRQEAYDNLVNSIFHQAYDDLVFMIRKSYRAIAAARSAQTPKLMLDARKEAQQYMHDAINLQKWFRQVMPMWRDVNVQRIIDKAYKDAEDDAEAIFARHREG